MLGVRRDPIVQSEHCSTEDERSLARAAKTDRAAFGALYDRYVRRVYWYCYRRLQMPEEAEDATSLVFAKALAAMPNYRENGPSFGAWLFAIAHNVVIDELHSRSKSIRGQGSFEVIHDTAPGPEEQLIRAENARELRSLLGQLPTDQAHVVELRLSGLTDKEIAFVLGRGHGAVRATQFRAVRRLRLLFGVQGKEQRGV